MHFTHVKSLLNASSPNAINRITAVAWSPNSVKCAVATSEKTIYIYNSNGERKDKFAAKNADPKV